MAKKISFDKYCKNIQKEIEKNVDESIELSKKRLVEVMGDDLESIRSIEFDLSKGKFKNVDAPEKAKQRLREKNLIIE